MSEIPSKTFEVLGRKYFREAILDDKNRKIAGMQLAGLKGRVHYLDNSNDGLVIKTESVVDYQRTLESVVFSESDSRIEQMLDTGVFLELETLEQ